MKRTPSLLLAAMVLTLSQVAASPFLSVSPSLNKARVSGQQTDVGFGVNFRTGYEFLNSSWLLNGHAIEFETGINGYKFGSGDPAIGDISSMAIPLLLNYRYTQYWGASRSDSSGMEYWSPDFLLYGGAGVGGVIVNAEETVGAAKLEISEFSPAFQFFFGTGVGFNDNVSLTGGYRHLWMGDIETEGFARNTYKTSLHVFDLNLRFLW
jgi:opacity protein-like surface antigen